MELRFVELLLSVGLSLFCFLEMNPVYVTQAAMEIIV